jgi:hypothetical protein
MAKHLWLSMPFSVFGEAGEADCGSLCEAAGLDEEVFFSDDLYDTKSVLP